MYNEKILTFAKKIIYPNSVEFKIRYENKREKNQDAYSFYKKGVSSYMIEANSARACLYAAYDILDGKEKGDFTPAFTIRGINPCETLARHDKAQIRRLIDRMGSWKMNTLVIHSQYGWKEHKECIEEECEKRGIEIVHYIHSTLAFLKGLTPEHFAKDKNGIPWTNAVECETRLCPSDKKALQYYKNRIESYLKEEIDGVERILFATADGYKICRCQKCYNINAIGQWLPIFEIFLDETKICAPHLFIEVLIYVQRYSLPPNLDRMKGVDRIMFDTHLRYRRAPLGKSHYNMPFQKEIEADPRAKDTPINIYLYDRLKEWRMAFAGKIYVFENLMLQWTWSLPQENTSIYLEDLKKFLAIGIDGVIYECFEPGIESFLPQFDIISKALWDVEILYNASDIEQEFLSSREPDVERFFELSDFDWRGYQTVDVVTLSHMQNAKEYFRNPNRKNALRLLHFVLENKNRFDWIGIAFSILQSLYQKNAFRNLTHAQQIFLTTTKLWDVMEPYRNPRQEMGRIIKELIQDAQKI